MKDLSLGVDIGGSKIRFCLVDSNFRVTPLGETATAHLRRGTVAFAQDLVGLIRATMPPDTTRVGLTLNGVLNGGFVVYSSLMGGAVDFPLDVYLSEALKVPVHVDDDIHAMTIAESVVGKGRETASFAMVNVGTGIGVGCFSSGAVLRGRFAAGLISEQHVFVEELGEWRSLDRTVCGRGIREMYLSLAKEPVEAATIFRRARAGEPVASRVIGIFARYLGLTFQYVSRFYHPELIIVNGSIKRAHDTYLDQALAFYEAGLEASFRARVVISEIDNAAELGTLLPQKVEAAIA